MIQKVKRFGEMELRLIFALEQKKNFIFTFSDARKILKTSVASVKNILKRLKKKNRVIRLQKGVYLFAPMKSGQDGFWSEHAFMVVPYLVKTKKYYIGFLSAMNYWGMTEQIPIIVTVALQRQKKSTEAVQSKFVFVKKPRLGESVPIDFGGVKVNISSREQTIIDGLLYPEYCLGIAEIAKAIQTTRKELDWEKLIQLAKQEKSVVRRRLGHLLDVLKIKKYSKQLEEKFIGFNWLDSHSNKEIISYSKKWGLKLNLSEKQLLDFMEVY